MINNNQFWRGKSTLAESQRKESILTALRFVEFPIKVKDAYREVSDMFYSGNLPICEQTFRKHVCSLADEGLVEIKVVLNELSRPGKTTLITQVKRV